MFDCNKLIFEKITEQIILFITANDVEPKSPLSVLSTIKWLYDFII